MWIRGQRGVAGREGRLGPHRFHSTNRIVFLTIYRPIAKKFPWFRRGDDAVKKLAGIAIAAVTQRLENPSDRDDLLSKLQAGKDENGNPLGREELTAEALTQLIAGE